MWAVVLYELEYPNGYVAAVCTTAEEAIAVVRKLGQDIGKELVASEKESVNFELRPDEPIEVRIQKVELNKWSPIGYTCNSDVCNLVEKITAQKPPA